MKFTQIPADTFEHLQMNAGILLDEFNPATGVVGDIIGATTGGINFIAQPSFVNVGEDVDNAPANAKEFKKLESWAASMSGTFVSVTAEVAKLLTGAADIASDDATHIIPRNDILDSDFKGIWWVGDYSELNGDKNGGFCAVHLLNALNTAGFQIQTTKNGKGQFAFTFEGHYSIAELSKVPFEIYIKEGSAES